MRRAWDPISALLPTSFIVLGTSPLGVLIGPVVKIKRDNLWKFPAHSQPLSLPSLIHRPWATGSSMAHILFIFTFTPTFNQQLLWSLQEHRPQFLVLYWGHLFIWLGPLGMIQKGYENKPWGFCLKIADHFRETYSNLNYFISLFLLNINNEHCPWHQGIIYVHFMPSGTVREDDLSTFSYCKI